MRREQGMLAALLLMCAVLAISNPDFLGQPNVINTLRQVSMLGIVAIGGSFVIITGGIDLSVGSVIGLTGVIIAKLSSTASGGLGHPLLFGISVALIVALLIGLAQGLLITRLKLQPFIVTLGGMLLLRGVSQTIVQGGTLSFGASPLLHLANDGLFQHAGDPLVPYPLLMFLGVIGVATFLLHYTVFGRYVYAIGGNRDAARYSGIDVKKVETSTYVISAGLAGVAGICYAAYIGQMSQQVGVAYELYAIAAVVLGGCSLRGGEGTVLGVVIGSAMMRVIDNGINMFQVAYKDGAGMQRLWRLNPNWTFVIVGGVILIAVVLDQVVHMMQASRQLRKAMLLAIVLAIAPAMAAAQAASPPDKLPFLDPTRPLVARVSDLVARMTLDEKISQMVDHAAEIPRLRVPSYVWWNESLHGVAFAGNATTFPQVIGMAATWDTSLVRRIGDVTSTEARAKYHEAIRGNDRSWFYGLTFWAPNVNIFRDPRWGRGQETYGEDPFLTSRLGVAFVTGMQGDDPSYLKVVATPKHFAVHSGPEPLRHHFNVDVSPHDLEDTYLPAFRATLTEGHAQSVMCAYNAIDGAPACANTMLLRDHLRRDWGFGGYVVSDCAAIADVAMGHKYTADLAHAAAASLKAGTDLECGFDPGLAYRALGDAVKQNLVSESEINTAVRRLFTARFRLGMFDPPESYAYGRIPFTEVNSAPHRALALQAAREAIVLLKNAGGFLPLGSKTKRIAVVGPTANLVQALQGNYNATPPNPVTPIAGIEKRFTRARVTYAQGSVLVDGLPSPIAHTALRADGAQGLRGEYFDNTEFRGTPAAVRIDRAVNFNWDKTTPIAGLHRNEYSVRWTGTVTPPAPGDYTLDARVNNCYGCQTPETYRILVDGARIADGASPDYRDSSAARRREGVIHFDDTKPHAITFEYVHHANAGGVDLRWLPPASAMRAEAVATARAADVVVAFLGLSPELEGEEMPVRLPGFSGGDRTDIRLPAVQRDLLYALSATGVPVVVVLTSGSALAFDDGRARAVLEAWYSGEEGGTAIAETLAGDNNPAGRLPVTFYASDDQLPPFDEYAMGDRTYRYFRGTPRFGFGFGLSYSTFHYANLALPTSPVRAGDSVTVSVSVTNQGKLAGDEVVQLYISPPKAAVTPARMLAGFTRIHLAAGETKRVTLRLTPRALSVVNENGERIIAPGTYGLSVGGAQPGIGGIRTSLVVRGTPVVLPR